jgi:hypothetical protein
VAGVHGGGGGSHHCRLGALSVLESLARMRSLEPIDRHLPGATVLLLQLPEHLLVPLVKIGDPLHPWIGSTLGRSCAGCAQQPYKAAEHRVNPVGVAVVRTGSE